MIIYKRSKKFIPRQDLETGEWFFNGNWYSEYPGKEISKLEGQIDKYWEHKLDEKRDTTGNAWHGGN